MHLALPDLSSLLLSASSLAKSLGLELQEADRRSQGCGRVPRQHDHPACGLWDYLAPDRSCLSVGLPLPEVAEKSSPSMPWAQRIPEHPREVEQQAVRLAAEPRAEPCALKTRQTVGPTGLRPRKTPLRPCLMLHVPLGVLSRAHTSSIAHLRPGLHIPGRACLQSTALALGYRTEQFVPSGAGVPQGSPGP